METKLNPLGRKGIILAGGAGTRLHPVTLAVNKQLLPVYDKPMIYYPLSTLMLAGIQEVLIISTPDALPNFKNLLGNGSRLGMKLFYESQPHPGGLSQAFTIGEQFLDGKPSCLVLGDNIFYGHGFTPLLRAASHRVEGATVFGYYVSDPKRYGVAEFDVAGKVISLEEKPLKPKSNYAVTGLYFYDNKVCNYVKDQAPSERGELEITDTNLRYLAENKLHFEKMGRGIAWLDTGTHQSLVQATNFVEAVENRQGLKISCIEEIAWRQNFINDSDLLSIALGMKGEYGSYLKSICKKS